jgi:hypothetical protein
MIMWGMLRAQPAGHAAYALSQFLLMYAWWNGKKIPQNLDYYLSRITESRAFFTKASESGLSVWPPSQLASFLLLGTRVALQFFGLCDLGHILSKWSFFSVASSNFSTISSLDRRVSS